MIEELENGGGNGRQTNEMIEKAGGQTEVEAAEETPAESDSRPTFATLIPLVVICTDERKSSGGREWGFQC
jgi:hypothetical protein